MKKKFMRCVILMMIAATLLVACGTENKLLKAVTQTEDKIELDSKFIASNYFDCEDGYTIEIKDGTEIDTTKLGSEMAVFIITDGENEVEEEFSFEIVDTQPPIITAVDTVIPIGGEYDLAALASCTDNSGEEITVEVKDGSVDNTIAGMYQLTLEATDSSGNTATSNVNIKVSTFEDIEEVMDIVDQYLSKNGLDDFYYNSNSSNSAVYIYSPYFTTNTIDSNRTIRFQVSIMLNQDIMRALDDGTMPFGCSRVSFNFEVRDTGDNLSNRYSLYADSITFTDGNTSFKGEINSIPSVGEYERSYYLSKLGYYLESEMVQKLSEMIKNNSVVMKIDTHTSKDIPVELSYTCNESDLEILSEVVEMYDYFLSVFGE